MTPSTPPASYRVAIAQLTSTQDVAHSVSQAESRVQHAADAGADVVTLPEATPFLGPEDQKLAVAEPLDGPLCQRFGALAARFQVHLLLGSFFERSPEEARVYNTSVWFGPDGGTRATYRKIHLFDAEVGDGSAYRESRSTAPGDQATWVDTPWDRWGLSICYDLRFPGLYQDLADGGATVLAVPSAFTVPTGAAHWEVLVRARAIEHHVYVVAPAQGGDHGHGRKTWGHGMIVGPDGYVLAQTGPHAPVAVAEVDPGACERERLRLPTHIHRRAYGAGAPSPCGSSQAG